MSADAKSYDLFSTPFSQAREQYHLVFIGHFYEALKILHFNAGGDDVAIADALKLAEGRTAELWNGDHLLRRFNPPDASS